jgi:hypothetical protein
MLTTPQTILLIGIILAVILYRRAEDNHFRKYGVDSTDDLQKYLLNEATLEKSKKPILWIHIPYEYNSRKWVDFGSRSSFELNQPYLYLTVKSIIKHCENDFHICLIDDGAFARVIPDWKIDMSKLSDPILKNIRQLALVKLIYRYGGMSVPIEFVCLQNLHHMYVKGVSDGSMFICENVNKNITSTEYDFCPDLRFMGANKNNNTVRMLLDFMQRTISTDNTCETEFLGEFSRWVGSKIKNGHVRLIDGKRVGVKTVDNVAITADELLSEDYLSFYDNAVGIWVPAKDILNRTSLEWFVRMSPEQVLNARSILSKYMLISLTPGGVHGVIEESKEPGPNWVNFWKVPSMNTPIYGLKPINLGDYVPRVHL